MQVLVGFHWCFIAADTDDEANVHPLFRCNVSLSIPMISIVPKPDEVQTAVIKAVKLIVGSLKSVEQWTLIFSDVDEDDQRPATSGNVTGFVTQLYSLHEHLSTLVLFYFHILQNQVQWVCVVRSDR